MTIKQAYDNWNQDRKELDEFSFYMGTVFILMTIEKLSAGEMADKFLAYREEAKNYIKEKI